MTVDLRRIASAIALCAGMAIGLAPVAQAASHGSHHARKHHHHAAAHRSKIPQHNGGDRDGDNNGGRTDGDGNT